MQTPCRIGEWIQAGSDSTTARSVVWTRQTSGAAGNSYRIVVLSNSWHSRGGALIHTGPSLIYSAPEEVCRASPGVDALSFFLFCPHDYIRALCAGDHRHRLRRRSRFDRLLASCSTCCLLY